MSRRSRRPIAIAGPPALVRRCAAPLAAAALAMALVAGPGAARARADEVAAYLEELGLEDLLAVHLEERVEAATGEERDEILTRLADLYAQLLESETDAGERDRLEAAGRRLLAVAEAGSANRLRLALLRASFRTAERTAEQHRLRLAEPDQVESARATLSELIPDLQRLRADLAKQVELVDRRRERASGASAIMLTEEAEAITRLSGEATFVTAWALYYQSWLHERRDNARAAERLFLELLDLGGEAPVPGNVSVDLRSDESIARCILGMGLARSMTSSSTTALAWLALLEHERTWPPLREQVPAWQLAVHVEHGEYIDGRRVLEFRRGTEEGLPVQWLRLAAVAALEADADSGSARELARFAVTELAARGELGQVYDLAQRYGIEALGGSGFAFRYVNGVLGYYEARNAHGADVPTSDPALAAQYGTAREALVAARRENDAASFAAMLPDCARLIGWCLFFEGRLLDARSAFVEAAGMLPRDEAAEALWMAIVSLDRVVDAGRGNATLDDELRGLIDRFLAEHPSSPHAPTLVLRRAVGTSAASAASVEALLAIPPNSDVYVPARRRAAQLLYRLFRDAPAAQRGAWGERYLDVAMPLFARDEAAVDGGDASAQPRLLVRGRRMLEIALTDDVRRLLSARRVLAGLDRQAATGRLDLAAVAAELAYRRVRERLLAGALDEAAAGADALHASAPDGPWSRRASRSVYVQAQRAWRTARDEGRDDRREAELVVRFGERVLAEVAGPDGAIETNAAISCAAGVGRALLATWDRTGDAAVAVRALELHEQLLVARPRNADFLRAVAVLAEEQAQPERALDCWRTLLAGSDRGTSRWFEAKYHVVRLLAQTDPARAAEVLEQHRRLNPDYGPPPWGERLRRIGERLSGAAPTTNGPGAGTEDRP